MKRTVFTLAMLVMLGFIAFHVTYAVAAGSADLPPIRVVVVSGSNYDMGVQYGEQAADLIAGNRDVINELLSTRVCYDPFCEAPVPPEIIEKDIQVWTYYLEKYDPQLKEWLLGISQGCKNKGFSVSYRDLVANMVLPQEMWARPGMPYPSETGVVASLTTKKPSLLAKGRTDTRAVASCTSFAAAGSATQGHEPMVSLTTGFVAEVKLYVVLVAFPNEGERFIGLTEAGRVSSNKGMNDKFAWIMTAAVNAPWLPCASSWGVTSEIYFHYLQQYCKSPAEAKAYIDATLAKGVVGGVTGNFLFADQSGISAYEVGACASAVLDTSSNFIVHTNNYNDPSMVPYNLGADYFSDTFYRYATALQKVSSAAQQGALGLDFAKALFTANDWYDYIGGSWHTVPVPNDPNDPNTCNVPGNNCEGGEGQVIQFPAQKTTYLQAGGPAGTTIQYFWPDNPKPTGEYMKWQLKDSIDEMARAASEDALGMIATAEKSFELKAAVLNPQTRNPLKQLLAKASQTWWKAKVSQQSAEREKQNKKVQMAMWGEAYTDYAIAQLYAQMVSTKLKNIAQ